MNKVLILRGPSGVGKSTISLSIQQKLGLNWAVIDVDKFKHYMPKAMMWFLRKCIRKTKTAKLYNS